MAGAPPTYRVILTFVPDKFTVTNEIVRTGINENQLAAWSNKKVWNDNPGLFWIQIIQEN